MRRSIYLLLAVVLGLSCSDNAFLMEEESGEWRGSGKLISESRDVTDFRAIQAEGPITTVVSRGEGPQLMVTADDNIIHRVVASVRGNTLYLSLKDGNYHNIWVRVEVRLPALEGLVNAGNGSMQVKGIASDGLLALRNSGSGTVFLEGYAQALTLENTGSGSVRAFELQTNQCHVENLGSGSCELYCTGTLEGLNSGSGSIRYKGPAGVSVRNTGSGSVVLAPQEEGEGVGDLVFL